MDTPTLEGDLSTPHFSADEKRYLLKQITAAETLERYLHTKYVGKNAFQWKAAKARLQA